MTSKSVGRDLLDGLDGLLEAGHGHGGKPRRSARARNTHRSKEKARATKKKSQPSWPAGGGAGQRERLTVQLPIGLLERLRNAVYWSPGLTVAGLVERGIESELARLEKVNGGPFSPRSAELKAGRPVK